jgi:hypothetical protein
MISDYINKIAVSNMTFEEFEKSQGDNIEIGRHKLTVKQAFIELGGTFKKEVKKPIYKKSKSKEVKSIED